MMLVEQTIKITISDGKYLTLSKDEAEQLYTALSNALNKTSNSSLHYPLPSHRSNNILLADKPIVAQGAT